MCVEGLVWIRQEEEWNVEGVEGLGAVLRWFWTCADNEMGVRGRV